MTTLCRVLHDAQIGAHLALDVRPLNLDGHRGAVVQGSAMHLRRRGGRERRRLEGCKDLFRGCAKLLDDNLAHQRRLKGRHVAL